MGEILKFIDRWAGGVTQLAAILLPVIFYLLAYKYADKRTIEYRWLRDVSFVILMILSVGNLVKLASEQYSKWSEANRKLIEISPSEIPVRVGAFQSSTTVTVINRAESPLHQVWIRVILSDADVHWDQLKVTPRFSLEKRRLVAGPTGAIYVSSDVSGLGAVDSTGRELLCILLRSIPPKSNLGFDLTLNASSDSSVSRGGNLLLDVWSYSTEPTEYVERDRDGGREAGMKIRTPEALTLLGMSVILSPDKD